MRAKGPPPSPITVSCPVNAFTRCGRRQCHGREPRVDHSTGRRRDCDPRKARYPDRASAGHRAPPARGPECRAWPSLRTRHGTPSADRFFDLRLIRWRTSHLSGTKAAAGEAAALRLDDKPLRLTGRKFTLPSCVRSDFANAAGSSSSRGDCAGSTMPKRACNHALAVAASASVTSPAASPARSTRVAPARNCARYADSDEAAPLFRDDCAPGFRDDLAPLRLGSCWL